MSNIIIHRTVANTVLLRTMTNILLIHTVTNAVLAHTTTSTFLRNTVTNTVLPHKATTIRHDTMPSLDHLFSRNNIYGGKLLKHTRKIEESVDIGHCLLRPAENCTYRSLQLVICNDLVQLVNYFARIQEVNRLVSLCR